ncbi:MAG: hypothetical protein K8L99_33805 [Anaerolineae bacterium]|nr:hypothetical protein [Anaerolineae bacterium]
MKYTIILDYLYTEDGGEYHELAALPEGEHEEVSVPVLIDLQRTYLRTLIQNLNASALMYLYSPSIVEFIQFEAFESESDAYTFIPEDQHVRLKVIRAQIVNFSSTLIEGESADYRIEFVGRKPVKGFLFLNTSMDVILEAVKGKDRDA